MIRAVGKWTLIVGALAGVAPALGWAWNALVRAGDGGPAATALTSVSAIGGVGALAGVFAVALALGALAARIYGERTGQLVAGFALAGPAWASGAMIDLLRWASPGGAFTMLAIEGAMVGALGALLWAVIHGVANRAAVGRGEPHAGATSLLNTQGLLGFCAAVAGGAAVAWLIARESTPGQSLAAGVIGAFGAGAAARAVAPRCQGLSIAIALGTLAAAAPLVARFTAGPDALRAVYEQRIANIGLLMPFDWIAGALLGAPVGMAWAASLTEKKAATPAPA